MAESLHPRKRYNAAAENLIKVLGRIKTLFAHNGFNVPVSVHIHARAVVAWNPKTKQFYFQEEGNPAKVIVGDINSPTVDVINLDPAIELLCVLPQLFEAAGVARDERAERMEVATKHAEAWLQKLKPYPVVP